MFKSLHMKLVLIMLLLIISLMTIVGAFLINGVVGFFINDFYEQMQQLFSDQEFVEGLRAEAAQDNGAEKLGEMIMAHSGSLGIDTVTRNYYILDGWTGAYLTGSDDELGAELKVTPNILTALAGEEGYQSDRISDYIDVALPIRGGENSYIIYIKDTGETMRALNAEMFMIILEAGSIGLVISVLLSFLLSKSMVAPIERLTEGVEHVAAGDFSRQIEAGSRDEIGVLTSTFNEMAGVLQETLEEIENERTKLDALFLHMTDGVVAFSRTGALIHKNPAAEQLLGERISEDRNYDSLFGSLCPMEQLLQLHALDSITLEHSANGKELELHFAPFSGEGTPGGFLALIHDVTTQKKEEQLRREFVANVSHELRTPLTNVRSYAETLADGLGDLPQEMAENFIGVILSETDRMTHIVQDLLTLSRFDSGTSTLSLEPMSIYQAIENVYDAVLLEAQRHDHILLLNVQEGLPVIQGDRARIEQVLLNILSNAIKYTPNGGTIRLGAAREGNVIALTVQDNGIGIPKEDMPRIFERFYRVDKARSRESGGTGLGLAIAREMVLQHDGNISIQSEPGVGTTVRITLPIRGEGGA